MALTTPEIIAGTALALSIISFIWQRFGVLIGLKKEQYDLTLDVQKQLNESKSSWATQLITMRDAILSQVSTQTSDIFREAGELSNKVILIDNRLTKQETRLEVFWEDILPTLKIVIKQPIHFRKDDLIDRFPDKLSFDETCELKETLRNEKIELLEKAKELNQEKKAYLLAIALMLARIDGLLLDKGGKCLI